MNKKDFLKLLSAGIISFPFLKLNELGDGIKIAKGMNGTIGISKLEPSLWLDTDFEKIEMKCDMSVKDGKVIILNIFYLYLKNEPNPISFTIPEEFIV